MQALVLAGERSASVQDIAPPVPDPDRDEIVVDVVTSAICSTDRKAYLRGTPSPRVLGHEFAGRLADGSAVAVHPEVSCGSCHHCRQGYENRCSRRRSIGLGRDGGFAEQVAVPRDRVLRLDPLDAELGPLLEPLACCLHAIERMRPEPGEHALVVGAGAIGILSMWVLQAAGCTVTVAQRSADRRDLARTHGAESAVAGDRDLAGGGEHRPTLAVVTAPGSAALVYAAEQVDVGARLHAMAGTPGGAPVDANLVHYRHLTVHGSTGSTYRDFQRAHELAVSGSVPIERLPVVHVELADLPGALASPTPRGTLKTLVDVRAR